MSQLNVQSNQNSNSGSNTVMSNAHFEMFVKGDLLNYMQKNNLSGIVINDGAGKKGVIRLNSKGEYKVSITSNETL